MKEPKLPSTAKVSITEAAKELGISRATLYRHAKDGLIKYSVRRSNGYIFVTGEAIRRYYNTM